MSFLVGFDTVFCDEVPLWREGTGRTGEFSDKYSDNLKSISQPLSKGGQRTI